MLRRSDPWLAAGAETYKLKFGHRAVNHPCMDLETGGVSLHSEPWLHYRSELPENTEFLANFVNINDKTVEGIKHRKKPFWVFSGTRKAHRAHTILDFYLTDSLRRP